VSPRRTRAKDLRRRTATRPERKTIVVFCEGEATEPDYINALKRVPKIHDNTAIAIEIDPEQGVPLTLVKRAVQQARDGEVDECWCVFDVEWPKNHPHLREAVQLAHAHGIGLAVSNPCFELWLALHFEVCGAFVDTSQAESRSRRLDGRQGKRIDAGEYMERRYIAVARAAELQQRHERDGTSFPDDNPSSTMFEFLSAIEP
jgi:hypothetical protein